MYNDNLLGTIWFGEVINISDPLKIGRVKIKVFGKFDNLTEDVIPWAFPYSVNNTGNLEIPQIGELFNVFFENGNIQVPFYTSPVKINNETLTELETDYPNVWSLIYKNNIGNDKSLQIFYSNTKGLIIKKSDSFIQIDNKDESIILSSPKKTIHLTDTISLGTLNKSKESAVLGDTLENLLNEFITELGKIGSIPTPAGPTGTLNMSPQWTLLVNTFKNKWTEIKSKIVSLD